ncbi:MAG TPA: hypothetical protein DEF02_04875 [Clostridiales bacterium]|nr:hypothetical protein [Clostridiales bacterium]HBW05886.1 hypothetical protein [Clostridiales bacterium]
MSDQVMNQEEMNQDVQNEQLAEQLALDADMLNRDQNGNVIPAFPVSKRTKKDQSKTSVLYTVAAILLHVLAYLPIVIVPIVLAVKCYNLMPYYTFWPFVGVILAGVLGLVFMTVALVVNRKTSKSSIRTKTVKVLIAFVCLSTGFSLVLTYVVPDIIAKATQSTLYIEDVYYNGEKQAEHNAALERDFIMYNLLNGNLNNYDADGKIAENGDFSYKTLVAHNENNGVITNYKNAFIQQRMKYYDSQYGKNNKDKGIYGEKNVGLIQPEVDALKSNERKYELYQFIYNQYVLNDYDFCFNNSVARRAIALSILEYIYTYYDYEGMLKEGFKNVRLKTLFQQNYDSFNQDGYLTFDDPLLLYAQMSGRMTVPVVLRLILNQGWTYTQSSYNGAGGLTYTEDGNCLYQLYDPQLVEEFKANGGKFEYTGTIVDQNGNEKQVKYGFNKDGWQMYENGVTKRPLSWLVLDMLGDPMALTTLDVANMLGSQIYGLVQNVLDQFPTLIDSVGGLMQEDLVEVVKAAAGGAQLSVGLCIDDDGLIAINLFPMNAPYGMLGYMQATWVDSDNLLMAVINVAGLCKWLTIFGAIGSVLIVAAGVCRDMGEKTRKRTEDSRNRILRAQAAEENGIGVGKPDEGEDVAPDIPDAISA